MGLETVRIYCGPDSCIWCFLGHEEVTEKENKEAEPVNDMVNPLPEGGAGEDLSTSTASVKDKEIKEAMPKQEKEDGK